MNKESGSAGLREIIGINPNERILEELIERSSICEVIEDLASVCRKRVAEAGGDNVWWETGRRLLEVVDWYDGCITEGGGQS